MSTHFDVVATDTNGSGYMNESNGVAANQPMVYPVTDGEGAKGSFFETYYSLPRFVTETILATASLVCNAVAVGVLRNVHGSYQTVHHKLFINLAISNMLASVLSWLCNNTMLLFEDQITMLLIKGHSICDIYVILLAAMFTSQSFGIVSTLTILGFTTVQYYAICKPLYHLSIIRKGRIRMFIAMTWVLTLASAIIPFSIVAYMSNNGICDENMLGTILRVVVTGANTSISVVAIIYITIVAMCLRIYWEIRKLQTRLSQFRFDQSVSGERKAFVTIVILLTTLTAFFIPYSVVFVITLNTNAGIDMHSDAMIYYMTALPYIKYFTDPLIYGMRMREVREGLRRALIQCGFRKCMGNAPELLSQPPSITVQSTLPAVTTV